MKIVILVGGLPPLYNGGTEIATTKIIEYAVKSGHEVHVVAADGTMQLKNRYVSLEKDCKIHRIMTMPPRYLHGITYIPGAVSAILRLKPDLVHAQAIYTAPSAYIVNRLSGIPYVLYERGGIYINYWLSSFLRKLLFGNAHRIIAQTGHQKLEILKYVKRDIEVIPNGIDAERFGKLSKKEARNKLGLPLDKKIVLSIGRFRPEKNLKCFINAAMANSDEYQSKGMSLYSEYINNQLKNLYIMVGDGQQLNELKEYAKDYHNIIFVGLVPNKDVPDYLCAADVLVNTSFSEGFPVSILEAMASGLPIVAPNVCGIPEIVKDGVNGILVESNNYIATATAINAILCNKELAGIMSTNNKEKAKRYTWKNVVKKLYG